MTTYRKTMREALEEMLEEELSPEQIAAEEQKAMDQFNSDMAKEFPAAKFTAKATTSPLGGGIAFMFAVIPTKDAKGVDLLNAPAHSKYMMHLTDNKNNRIAMSKFSIEQIMGNTFPVKFRKITGKSPTDAVKKMVDWFKKNKDGFETLVVEEADLDEGTWALPDTPKQKAALKKLLSKPLKAKDATDKLYALIGDDQMADDLDDYADKNPNDDVRAMVKSHMKRLGIKEEADLNKLPDMRDALRQVRFGEDANLNEARQLKDPKKEVMVVKKGKVIVIDKKDQDNYMKKGWELAEEADLDEGYERTVLLALSRDDIGGYFSNDVLYVAQRKIEDAKAAIKADSNIKVVPKIMGEEVDLDEAKYTRKLMKDKSVVDYVKSQQEKNRKRGNTPQDGAVYHGANWVDIAADAIGMNKMSLSKKKAFDWDSEYEAVAKKLGEEVELDEAKYDLYHKDFSSAMQHAYKMAKKLHGITVDPKEIDDKVASGPSKPSEGKTNSYRLKGDKGAIQVQVYNTGGSKPFELNFYKEEVDLDEEVSVKDFDALKKGDTVTVEYKSAMSSGKGTFAVTTKNKVAKGKVEKVTLKSTKNPGGVKHFLYKRDNKVSFAQGDMGASVVSFKKEEVDEKYDSDKFFDGKGTPEQRLQLLKLQNKALRALGGSPKQKEIKKEINALRKKMGMKVKEEVELDEGTKQVLAHGGKGQYKAVSDGGVVNIMYKGKVISSGDFDRGADGWFLNIKGEKGQKFFDDAQKMVDYFAKNKITEEVELDEFTVSDVEIAMKKKYGKVDKEAIEKLKKVQHMGNVDRNALVKVGHGKLHVESVELGEASKEGTIKIIKTKDGKFQIQKMTKGKFVDIGKPYNSQKEAEKFRSGQPDLFGEGAAADARRAMARDKDFSRRDSADDDTTATDDDVKAASKNILMQLRKAVSLKSFNVEFGDGKHKVDAKIAQAVQNKYNSMRRPADKEKYQMQIAKSYKGMLQSLKAGYGEQKESILHRIDRKLKERKNG